MAVRKPCWERLLADSNKHGIMRRFALEEIVKGLKASGMRGAVRVVF
jgi:hypothetical protein